MQPIYNKFIKFLEDKTNTELNISEGIYWLDNHAIKAFDRNGNIHTVYKYKVDSDLNVTIIKKEDISTFETWSDTIKRYANHINELAEDSMNLIKTAFEKYDGYDFFALTSTGKDSTVVIDLVNRVKETQVVFNNTSLDCAGTYKMAKSHSDWIITNPEEGFYQWIKRNNFIPTRFSRACCGVFKEGNHIKYFKDRSQKTLWFMGVRNDESANRADREDFTHNPKWGNLDWYGCLPIRKWSEFDVWLYTLARNLEINPKYKEGYLRVGCAIACPYSSKYTWVLDEYFYPTMYDRWHRILDEVFIEGERWVKMNCTQKEYHKCWNGGLYREEPTQDVVDEFMQHKGLADKNVAMQYFNKACCECGKNVRQGDVLGMNLKLIGRDTGNIYCRKHLKEKFGIDNKTYDKMIEDFKIQGCTLF